MSEFRWLLLAAGILVLALVFWLTGREASGQPVFPSSLLRRLAPRTETKLDGPSDTSPPSASAVFNRASAVDRIITVRLMGQGSATFPGEALVVALREAGLRHGKFGIFHRHESTDESQILFSVASLVEPGSFDLTRLKSERFPGVSLFLALSADSNGVAKFDDMLSTARGLVGKLGGELLDESGSRLSVQRERYLREEVIRYQHKLAPP